LAAEPFGSLALAATGAAAAPAVELESIEATAWPIFTSVPTATLREILPAASAVPSEVILSVSSSKRGWSFLTMSPSLTCHLERTPELMDSPMGGILTSRRAMMEKMRVMRGRLIAKTQSREG
jgi:hypothetical protein